jgi:hypothetical protein
MIVYLMMLVISASSDACARCADLDAKISSVVIETPGGVGSRRQRITVTGSIMNVSQDEVDFATFALTEGIRRGIRFWPVGQPGVLQITVPPFPLEISREGEKRITLRSNETHQFTVVTELSNEGHRLRLETDKGVNEQQFLGTGQYAVTLCAYLAGQRARPVESCGLAWADVTR